METYQIFLMIIGGIATIWLIVKAFKGFFWLLGTMIESGFRGRYPTDFLIHLGWVVDEMESNGYVVATLIDEGGEYPGVIMKHPEKGGEMEVRLRAPLFLKEGSTYSIIIVNHQNDTGIVMPVSESDDCRELLIFFLGKRYINS